MDRCPKCRGALSFIGIASRGTWARWLICSVCGVYTSTDPFGGLLQVTVKEPDEKAFITFEPRNRR